MPASRRAAIKGKSAVAINKLAFALLVAASLTGCAGYMKMVNGLNRRNVQSCLQYGGMVGGIMTGSGTVVGVTVTGGADLELCERILHGG
jgi:hypothetical protein